MIENAQNERIPTPVQRAAELYSFLRLHEPRPTQWDLVCFCVETLAVLSTELEFLRPEVKNLVSVLYTAHYNTPDEWPSCLPK